MKRVRILFVFLLLGLLCSPVFGQPKLPPPDDTDPVKLGIMVGFPPPADKQVTFENSYSFPKTRWFFHHLRELCPTRNIWRGSGPASPLPTTLRDLGGLAFADDKGQRTTIADWQKNTYTDAMIVLHKGRIVYEQYYAGMKPEQPHLLYSVTKSLTGLMATQLIHEGQLDPKAKVTRYLPELADSAWGDATVQEILDMTAAIRFREIYTDPTTEIYQYAFSSGMAPRPPNYAGPKTLYDFLKTLKKEGEHGAGFQYRTVNSEVVGWILRRITGKNTAEMLSEKIWGPLGAEQDAYYWVDSIGTELMGSGLNATLRDMARFAEMLRLNGRFNGREIVAKAVVEEIRKGADREKFKASGMTFRAGYSYHNQWWITHNTDGAYEAAGIHGQLVYINPAAETIVVKFSSHPLAANSYTHALNARAFQALADELRR